MRKQPLDAPFFLVLLALVVFGLLIFTSAALGLLARGGATFTSVAVSQLLLGFLCGGVALVVLSRVDYRVWRPYTPYFFCLALLLTLLTFVPGVGLTLKGAARWIAVGPISFQPAELLKFAVVLFLSGIYASRFRHIATLKGAARWIAVGPISFQPAELLKFAVVLFLSGIYASRFRHIATLKGGIVPLILVGGLSAGVLLLQPDTDGAVVILLACAVMLFAAGGRLRHLAALALVGLLVLGITAYERPYLAERFVTFLNHSADPQGAGWQIDQSLIAVGSGGWTGRGFGQSIEKFSYLPEPIGDSIFAVAAEEFGFVGSVALVLLFAAFALLGLRIAARAPDPFGGLLVVGLTVMIVGQSFMNIASTLGLIPLSGLPLIFVSHGGTSLAIALAEVGVILSVSRRMKS